MVAQAWLVATGLKLTNSSMMLGIVAFAGFLPILLVSLFAGAMVDHVDRRRLIIVAQTLLMISAFVLAGLTWTGAVRVEHVIILAALNGLVSSFDMPARQTFVVEMVGREDLPNAIAMNSMIFNGARMVGPAIAGLSIAAIGVAGCFFLNGVSFLAVIWSLFLMDVPRRASGGIGPAMFRKIREGLSYVWLHRPTLWLLIVVAINSGFAMQYTVLIPVFARDILHSGARGYGFLMAAQGLGAVAGAIIMNMRSSAPKTLRQNLVFGVFCTAIAVAAFGVSRWMALSLLAQVFIGVGLMNHMVTHQHDAATVRERRVARARDEHLHTVIHRRGSAGQSRSGLRRRASQPRRRGPWMRRLRARMRLAVAFEAKDDCRGTGTDRS